MRKSLRSLLYGRSGIRHRGGLSLEEAIVGNGTSVAMSMEKPQVVGTTRATVRMRHRGADYFIVATKRSNVRGAKRAGYPRRSHNGPTGNRRSLPVLTEGGSPHRMARAG